MTEIMRVRTFDKIAPQGLALFGDAYTVSADEPDPQLIITRSSKIDTDMFPSLRAVARAGAGVNNVTVEKATARGIPVFNTPGANAQAVAEMVFAVLGAYMRNVSAALAFASALSGTDEEIDAAVEAKKSAFKGGEIKGKTMGVIGLGKIGALVARGGIAREMKVVGYDASPALGSIEALHADGVAIVGDIENVLREADIISLHVPLLDATRGLINPARIAACKDGVILINYARREICDEAAVIAGLDQKKIKAFLTDFPSARTVGRADVFATPHLGASTREAEDTCAIMAVERLKRFAEEGSIEGAVNYKELEGRTRGV